MFYCPLAHALERMTYVYTAREQQMRANRKYQHLEFFLEEPVDHDKGCFHTKPTGNTAIQTDTH